MKPRPLLLLVTLLVLINGCATARPQTPEIEATERGLASWYGQEFAGRTTANGEIFDPLLLTAAHRTLPFGTVVEVKNPRNGQVVLVRINDRGPFVGNRTIDLSYAAADKLGMVKEGVGEVQMRILKVGAGELEPPAPIVVAAVPPATVRASRADAPPAVEFPLPIEVDHRTQSVERTTENPTVESVIVEEQRGGVALRREVAADGRTIVSAPVDGAPAVVVSDPRPVAPRPSPPAPSSAVAPRSTVIALQLGAFQSEANANILATKAREFASNTYVEKFRDLHRVRVGPFRTREAAVDMRERLEARGIGSFLVTE